MIKYAGFPANTSTYQNVYFYHALIMIKIYTVLFMILFAPFCLEKLDTAYCIFSANNDEEYIMRTLWCEARQKNMCQNCVDHFIPLPVRPEEILTYQQTFEAHGQKRPPDPMFRCATSLKRNSNRQTAFVARKRANFFLLDC